MATTYERYKEHTSRWTNWICGLCDANGSKTMRKEVAAGTGIPQLYEVSTTELLRQAQYLAGRCKQTGFQWTMPKDVWRSYQYAYKTRVQYAHRHAAAGEADDGHAYFNGMMEYVHSLLRNCVKVQSLSKVSSTVTGAENTTTFENPFQKLEEEDSTEDEYHYDDNISEASASFENSFEYKLDEFFDDHVKVMKQNLVIESFQMKRKALSEIYGPLKDYIALIWKQLNADDGTILPPEVASLVTEAAVVWIVHKESDLYDYGEFHKADLGEIQSPFFDLSSSSSKYLYSKVVNDVRTAQKMFTLPYPTALKPLDVRHQDKTSCFDDEGYLQQLLVEDKLIVQLLGEVGLEMEARVRHYKTRNTLLHQSLDELSLILHKALDNNTDGKDLRKIEFTLTFVAELLAGSGKDNTSIASVKLGQRVKEIQDLIDLVQKRLNLTVDEREVQLVLLEQLGAVVKWVTDWPVLARRKLYQQILETLSKQDPGRLEPLCGAIPPAAQDNFLRQVHDTLTAKLSCTIYALREELGLSTLNAAAHVFSGCHMVNGLKIFAQKTVSTHQRPTIDGNVIFKNTNIMSQRHMKDMFGVDYPTRELAQMLSICAGKSVQNLAPSVPGRETELKRSKRTKEIMPNKVVKILQDYLHQRITFLEMMYRIDKEIQHLHPQTHLQKSLLETDFMLFLEKFQIVMEEAMAWMEFDYLTFHCEWLDIFQKINARIQENGLSLKLFDELMEPSKEQWETQTGYPGKWYSFMITKAILIEIDETLEKEDKMRRGKVPTLSIPTPLVDAAIDVLAAHGQKESTS